MLTGKASVPQIGEYLHQERISPAFQVVKPPRQLLVNGAFYPVPEVHIRFFKQRIVGLLADKIVILVLPTVPRRLAVKGPLGFIGRSPGDLRKKFFSSRSRMSHDRVKKDP